MSSQSLELTVVGVGDARRLRVAAQSAASIGNFEGTAAESDGGVVLEGPLSSVNAAAARSAVPSLRPQPIGLRTSAGVGDRLGLATPGQARAFRESVAGIVPVFAQQSAREMDRLGRCPQQVMDDATFGILQAGWTSAVGSDADHLKSTADIDRCLDAGFTSFTLDPGEHVRPVTGDVQGAALAQLPWGDLEDDQQSMMRRYAGLTIDTGDSPLRIGEGDIRRAAAKYGAAIVYTVSMYRHLMDAASYPVEVEVSVDETDDVTTLAEHVYLATEMKRLGMKWVGFAPRYIGSFEKGVEYIGDRDVLFRSLVQHSHIATAFGPYKLSLHSGSDKFSIYELASEATGRVVHLKTSGTSYLVAIGIVARFAPQLFRDIYDVSREAFRAARASYQVSAQLDRMPASAAVADDRLSDLVTAFDTRQMLHVGYGPVLRTPDETGPSERSFALREVLTKHDGAYQDALAIHFGAHLKPFSQESN